MTPADDVQAALDDEEAATRWDVRAPGLFPGMPDTVYHGDPIPEESISSSMARRILEPGCPALVRWEKDHPEDREITPAMTAGTAAHSVVLGVGPQIVVPLDEHGTPYVRWDTNRCKQLVAEIRAAGNVPMKADAAAEIHAMRDALLEHEHARNLLEHKAGGIPEVSGFWRDPEYPSVWRRCRWDMLPEPMPDGRLILTDYKTADKVDRDSLSKSVHRLGYHQQGPWYVDGARELVKAAGSVAFALVFQSTKRPYLVAVRYLHSDAYRLGQQRNRRAVELWHQCKTTGVWPGFEGDQVTPIDVPAWAYTREQEETSDDD